MRKIFIALSLFCALGLSAENVSQDKAKQMAEDFLRQGRSRAAVSLRMVYDGESSASRSSGQSPALYVFDNEGQNGFVVVSGDDAAYPILGYSYDGDFPEGQLPANLASWLQGMKNQVNYLRGQGAPTLTGSRTSTGEVVKKLNTAKWDQGVPYDGESPKIGDTTSPTGCTATATAIAMRYVRWPEKRTVAIPGYKTSTLGFSVPGREVGEAYDWDQMLLEYKTGQYTEAQAAEVARLMADVGVMITSDYQVNATGSNLANVRDGLLTYMDYDKSIMLCERYMFVQQDWYNMLKAEFDANRPVIYSGYNNSAGHAFVLDGYTTEDYFSVNWGWSGYCNGYFRLDAMVPEGSGTGGNNSHYNDNQGALIGLKKNVGGEYIDFIAFSKKGFINLPDKIQKGVSFKLEYDGFYNFGSGDFSGTFLWALTDKNGSIKEELYKFSYNDLEPFSGFDFSITVTITSTINGGDRIRFFYKATGASDWTLVKGGEECVWEVIVKEEIDIDSNVSLKYERGSKRLVVKAADDIKVKLFTEDGQDISNRLGTSAQGKVINASRFDLGTYILRLEADEEVYREVKLKLGVAQ